MKTKTVDSKLENIVISNDLMNIYFVEKGLAILLNSIPETVNEARMLNTRLSETRNVKDISELNIKLINEKIELNNIFLKEICDSIDNLKKEENDSLKKNYLYSLLRFLKWI